jgi:hypothetical protein
MEMSRTILLLLALVVPLWLSPSVAWAEPTKEQIAEARAHYKKGLDLYDESDFDAALIEFQRAYDTAPAYKILYNIALVQRQLKDYAGSLRSFKRYLDDGGKRIDAKRITEVEREIEKLQGRVAEVKLTTNVEGAEVLVDDLEVGKTPLDEPLSVNAGKRKISVTKSGYATASRVIKVAGGDNVDLELELKKSSGGAAPAAPAGKPPAPDKPPVKEEPEPEPEAEGSSFPWVPWAITGALGAGAGVFAVLTLSAQSDLKNERDSVTTREKLDDAESKTKTFALVTDVLLAATVVSAGIALYITLDSGGDEPAEKEKAARRVELGIGPGAAMLRGTF